MRMIMLSPMVKEIYHSSKSNFVLSLKVFFSIINILRLTEKHKQTIRVIRKIKYFVARRKFQVINKLLILINVFLLINSFHWLL